MGNEFKLKDEEYFEDTDNEQIAIVDEKKNKNEDKEDENVFNPLSAYKDEIEEDKVHQSDKKKEEMEKLEAWRKQKKNERKMAYMVFKKEEDDYKKYKMEKEESLRVNGICSQQERIENTDNEQIAIVDEKKNKNEDK